MTSNTIPRSSFHVRALNWLRDRMEVETELLPSNVLTTATDPDHAYVRGHVVVGGRSDTLGFVALIAVMIAACFGMAASRPEFSDATTMVLQVTAGMLVVAAIVVVAVDASRTRARRRAVDIVVRARSERSVGPEMIEGWRAGARGALWIVSESGFDAAALDLARRHEVRCFMPEAGSITEVGTA
jgi:hypothetical protein